MPDRTDMEMTTRKADPGMLIDFYKAIEESSKGMTDKIDKKLDRLHERIDDILLTCCPPQNENGRHERRQNNDC